MSDAAGFTVGGHVGPTIEIKAGRTHEAANKGMTALVRARCDIYQRGGELVRPATIPTRAADGARIDTPGIIPVTEPYLRHELGLVARWERFDRKGEPMRCDPPAAVAAQVMAMAGHWPFNLLTATISTPTMRADGSLLIGEGYDPATGVMLLGAPQLPAIPEWPTQDDARTALATLKELLREFPFTTDAGRSVALSALITPIVRAACGDAVPLHAISKPEGGTGGSYLADLVALIATGNRCPAAAYHRNREEFEKLASALLLQGASIISVDNVNGTLASNFLCQAIERPLIPVRIFGKLETRLVPNSVLFLTNGNGLRVAGDLVRRTIGAELDAEVENPLTRVFATNPAAMILRDRGKYIAAILTLVRAFVVAGRPAQLVPMPSFEGWSSTVRGALVWLGEADPVGTNEVARDEDPTRQKLAAMLGAWPEDREAYTTAELIQWAEETSDGGALVRPEFAAAVRAVATDRRGRVTADALGKWLRDNKDRRGEGRKLTRRGTATRPLWHVETRRDGGGSGVCPLSAAREKSGDREDVEEREDESEREKTKKVPGSGNPTHPANPTTSDAGPDPVDELSAELIERLTAALARPRSWQRVADHERAAAYFAAQARRQLLHTKPAEREALVARAEAEGQP
jgi:putative DNA primase/helicase